MNKLLRKGNEGDAGNEAFDHWLLETCAGDDLSLPEKTFITLHVCDGIACAGTLRARVVFNQELMGKKVTVSCGSSLL